MQVSTTGRRVFIALSAACLTAVSVVAASVVTRRDAEQLRQKVAAIELFAVQPSPQARRTTLTENEVNAFLTFDARESLPAGVVDPAVSILGTGRVSGRATVDLDALRKQKNPTSMLDPTSYLTGRVPITAIGVLKTNGGVGRFDLESATVAGIPVPKPMLQQIVSFYSKSPDHPAGINLDDPFALPARIREIQVEPGRAIIVQ